MTVTKRMFSTIWNEAMLFSIGFTVGKHSQPCFIKQTDIHPDTASQLITRHHSHGTSRTGTRHTASQHWVSANLSGNNHGHDGALCGRRVNHIRASKRRGLYTRTAVGQLRGLSERGEAGRVVHGANTLSLTGCRFGTS